jgi:hypothetical protein
MGDISRQFEVQDSLNINIRSYSKNNQRKKDGYVAQVVDHLSSKLTGHPKFNSQNHQKKKNLYTRVVGKQSEETKVW